MSLIKWNDTPLDRFFDESFQFGSFFGGQQTMAMDIYEENGQIVAEVNMPGFKKEDISVSVENGYLRISGEHKEEEEQKDRHYYSKEIRHGSFERVIRLPENIDQDSIDATYDNGVLKVTMRRQQSEEKEQKKIAVK